MRLMLFPLAARPAGFAVDLDPQAARTFLFCLNMCSPLLLRVFAVNTEDIGNWRLSLRRVPHRAEHPAQRRGREEYRSGGRMCQSTRVGPSERGLSTKDTNFLSTKRTKEHEVLIPLRELRALGGQSGFCELRGLQFRSRRHAWGLFRFADAQWIGRRAAQLEQLIRKPGDGLGVALAGGA